MFRFAVLSLLYATGLAAKPTGYTKDTCTPVSQRSWNPLPVINGNGGDSAWGNADQIVMRQAGKSDKDYVSTAYVIFTCDKLYVKVQMQSGYYLTDGNNMDEQTVKISTDGSLDDSALAKPPTIAYQVLSDQEGWEAVFDISSYNMDAAEEIYVRFHACFDDSPGSNRCETTAYYGTLCASVACDGTSSSTSTTTTTTTTTDTQQAQTQTLADTTTQTAENQEAPSTTTTTVAPTTKASSSGDPHFKTWNGAKFDYHGECDLVLLDNPSFDNGKGMRVHIRTTRVNYYSYIETIAVKIGDEVLEFSNDVENFTINGEKVEGNVKFHDTLLSGYLVRKDKKAVSIRMDKTRNTKARVDLIQRRTGFPAVVVDADGTDVFQGSLGLLGEFKTGRKLARDGLTLLENPEDFALEWQVRQNEPMIFSSARFPQHPTTCTPPAKMLSSRLGSALARMEAEKLCAHWEEDIEDCIFDVIATRDATLAAEGHHENSAVVA